MYYSDVATNERNIHEVCYYSAATDRTKNIKQKKKIEPHRGIIVVVVVVAIVAAVVIVIICVVVVCGKLGLGRVCVVVKVDGGASC